MLCFKLKIKKILLKVSFTQAFFWFFQGLACSLKGTSLKKVFPSFFLLSFLFVLPFTVYSEEPSSQATDSSSKEASSKDSQEASENSPKEASSKDSQEASENSSKEASSKDSQEASENSPKEASSKDSQEASKNSPKEASSKDSQEASENSSKEASSKDSQEASENSPKEASSKDSQEASENSPKEASSKDSQEASENSSKEASSKDSQEASENSSKEASSKDSQEASENSPKEASSKDSQEAFSQVNNLDQLLEKIKEDQIQSRPELRAREKRFQEARDKQKSLLNQAKKELDREVLILSRLQAEFEKRDKELSQLEEKLTLTMGVLGELFGVVKQSSAEAGALFKTSVISAEYPNRQEWTKKISAKKNLPDIEDLEKLWFLMQQEMTESGKITHFETQVVSAQGQAQTQKVLRIGSFNLVSEAKYLIFDDETQKLLELTSQPRRRYLSLVKKLEKAVIKKAKNDSQESKTYKFGVDPSRGSLLSLLIQSPSLFERLAQGGVIGYLILFLLLTALILCIEKYRKLRFYESLVHSQLHSQEVLENNPLGEMMQVFNKFKQGSQETLELKMDEVFIKQIALINKGLSHVKLMANISPLLGLLGTVIGMIATFQSITLFGTGDPKLMAGGISQALVTTALGLVAAIPLIFIHSFLSGKASQIIQIFEEQLLNLLSKK